MFVFLEGGQIVGFYSLHVLEGQRCELNHLCVLPEFRHHWIGESLLLHAFEEGRKMDCLQMETGIVDENIRLRQWHESHGFVHTGRQKFGFFPFPFTSGYMKKDLAES